MDDWPVRVTRAVLGGATSIGLGIAGVSVIDPTLLTPPNALLFIAGGGVGVTTAWLAFNDVSTTDDGGDA